MTIWRVVRQQASRRWGRSLALMLGMLVAISGFTLLTATARTAQLTVTDVVDANARASYDILVRPAGSRTATELTEGLVRPNYLNGQYGGITTAQWRRVQAVAGVDTAAPVAVMGYSAALARAKVDLTEKVDRKRTRQVFRMRPTWIGDGGLSAARDPDARFAYVTRRPVAAGMVNGDLGYQAPDGSVVSADRIAALKCRVPYPFFELSTKGKWNLLCGTWAANFDPQLGHVNLNRAEFAVFQLLPDGTFLDFQRVTEAFVEGRGQRPKPVATRSAVFEWNWPLWFPMAAVDPEQESRLANLDQAVTSGSYLPTTLKSSEDGRLEVPVIVTARSPVEETLTVSLDRVDGKGVVGASPARLVRRLNAADGQALGRQELSARTAYSDVLADPEAWIRLDVTVQAGPPDYDTKSAGPPRARKLKVDPGAWRTDLSFFGEVGTGATALQPYLARDFGFRPVSPTAVRGFADQTNHPRVRVRGAFDPARTLDGSVLAAVPMETYRAPTVTGVDAAAERSLGGRALPPSNNPTGYVASPPAMLTTIDAATRLLDRPDPISAIRVRVTDVTGVDAVSRERVRLAAEAIVQQTGLDVDVTLGASPQLRSVVLPAGAFGRPELRVKEEWPKIGAAVAIVAATEGKSLFLFGLILVVCMSYLVNSVSASVRERRRELALLSCLGWPAFSRAALILGEVGAIGLGAGVLGTVLCAVVAGLLDLHLPWTRLWLPLPLALVIALLAAVIPALRASGRHPGSALRPMVTAFGRGRRPGGLAGLAFLNTVRSPGRTALAAMSLAVGVAALIMLAAARWGFEGAVIGTLLGDAVAVQVRGTDVLAVVLTVMLGLCAVGDATYLGARERAAEFATLRAVGWSESEVARLVVWEGIMLGIVGAVSGGFAGMAGMAAFMGSATWELVLFAILGTGAAVALAAVVALVPVGLLRRTPVAVLQAEQ